MDLDKWKDGLLMLIALLGGGTVAHRALKRQGSRDKLEEAENSVGASYVDGLIGELRDARKEAQTNFVRFMEEQARANMLETEVKRNREEIERLFRLEANSRSEVQRLVNQVDALTRVVVQYRPEEKLRLSKTGFGGLE